ncbi:MAG TPA: CDP-glycerol glycerophosphotransferase family protein [Nocardioidaceae bacterium]
MSEPGASRPLRRRVRSSVGRVLGGRRWRKERPLLSVVVPVYNPGPRLHRCLESLAKQTLTSLEIVIVDDGSTDGSLDVLRAFAELPGHVRLVRQQHRGVGPARDAGVRHATGEFLAFCDSDDEVPPAAYEKLVAALRQSGSELAIGSVVLQKQGIYRQPSWTRTSNPDRRLRVTLEEMPGVMANLLPGTRVFRRSFWDEQNLSFGEEDHREVVTMVEAILAATTLDVIPGVSYRWGWREDGSSLLQQDLRDSDRVRCKMAHVIEAAELVIAGTPSAVQRQFFANILHSLTPDLIRAAVTRDDGYWSALQGQMQRLMELVPAENLVQVAVEDRIAAWLCARAERAAAEDFLEYSFDNRNGYPFRHLDGRPHITLPFIDALSTVDASMTRVADVDMRYRTRLSAMRWAAPGVLRLEGGAFVEYTESTGAGEVSIVLRDRTSGAESVHAARSVRDEKINRWAGRAQEDHSRAGFVAEVDIAPTEPGTVLDVLVRVDADGDRREAPFESRRGTGSPGLLEPSEREGISLVPTWSPVHGLAVRVLGADHAPAAPAETDQEPAAGVMVEEIIGHADILELRLRAEHACEVALVGPRSRTAWTPTRREGASWSVVVSLLVDEWGAGPSSVPTDDYAVVARTCAGEDLPVLADRGLWRELPAFVDSETHQIQPRVVDAGRLELRVTPQEFRDSVGAYVRRRLRDVEYPEARERPLLDVAFFETFGGRAAGDNPGPLCAELARRDSGLDLVFSVLDRSVQVPDGARAVVRWSQEWFELLARARYLVTNAPLPPFFRKRPGQVFLHTWHGSPLKRIGHDRTHMDFPNWHHRRQLLLAREGWDFMVSQSPFCTASLRSAFLYDGGMLESGYPRNDLLSSPEGEGIRRRTRKHLGIAPETTVILYAPTWRDNYRAGRVFNKMVFLDTADVVQQVPNSTVLVRGHYNTMAEADVHGPDRRVVDVTRYPDIADLYLAADALVTDYSSVFFDFVLTGKPMYFLAPDLESYRDDNRGFYLDYHQTVPGPVGVTTQEVVDAILGPDEYVDVRRRFREEYAPWDDGHASERVIDAILRHGETVRDEAGS